MDKYVCCIVKKANIPRAERVRGKVIWDKLESIMAIWSTEPRYSEGSGDLVCVTWSRPEVYWCANGSVHKGFSTVNELLSSSQNIILPMSNTY